MAKKPTRSKKPAAAVEVAAPTSPIELPTPVSLSEIIGQQRALRTLSAAFESGRIHHAWIFAGPPGVGKFTTALAFAAAILDPTTRLLNGLPTPDPSSHVQTLLQAGSHPDLHIIVKELARFSDIDSVRAGKQTTIAKDVVETHLIGPAALASTLNSGGVAGKVFIVDEAELLDRSPTNAPSQNALLKTMEEPAPGTVIILVTSAEERLLPTIRSRCQRVAFSRLSHPEMEAWLSSQDLELDPEQRRWLMDFSDGSPGTLLHAVTAGLFQWQTTLAPMLDAITRAEPAPWLGPAMASLVEAEAQRVVKAAPNASKEAANFDAAMSVFNLLGEHARALIRQGISQQLGERAMRQRLRLADLLGEAQRQLEANVNMSLVLTNLAAQMSTTMEAGRPAR